MDKKIITEAALSSDASTKVQSYAKPALTFIGSFATLTQGSTGSFSNDFNTMMPNA